jgi:hypothetical protein
VSPRLVSAVDLPPRLASLSSRTAVQQRLKRRCGAPAVPGQKGGAARMGASGVPNHRAGRCRTAPVIVNLFASKRHPRRLCERRFPSALDDLCNYFVSDRHFLPVHHVNVRKRAVAHPRVSCGAETRHPRMTPRAWNGGPVHEIPGAPENLIQRLAYLEIPIGQTTSDHQMQQRHRNASVQGPLRSASPTNARTRASTVESIPLASAFSDYPVQAGARQQLGAPNVRTPMRPRMPG